MAQFKDLGNFARVLGLMALLALLIISWQWQPQVERDQEQRNRASANDDMKSSSAGIAVAPGTAFTATKSVHSKVASARSAPLPSAAPPIPLDAPALGHRASAAQRLSDLQRMMVATELAPLLVEFQRRAAQGDADAAARMREIFDECLGVHLNQADRTRAQLVVNYPFGPSMVGPDDPGRMAAMEIGRMRCRGIIPDGDHRTIVNTLARSMRESQQLAADFGQLPARVRSQPTWHPDPVVRARLQREQAVALLWEGNIESIWEMNGLPSMATPYSSEAWILAACAMGYPCESNVFFTSMWCVQFGAYCQVSSFPDFIRLAYSARAWRQTQAHRDDILARLRAGDIDGLLRPLDQPGDGE